MAEVVFLFPGQGAQTVGMGKDFYEASPAARRVYEEAADILDWDVSEVSFEGPADELNRTAISQPAILTTSLAIVEAMREAGCPEVEQCAAAAGLSLGEYSALVMAGAMSFSDALELVRKRGQFMEEACQLNPGTMVSVLGLEDGIVEAICAQVRETDMVVAANFNSPGQIVISGTREGVRKATDLAKEHGAKRTVPLTVSGAFHSPLMAPAAERLEDELNKTDISPCRIKVIGNVTAEPVREPDEIRNALARQVSSPVRWSQSMTGLIENGASRFIEVGPGRVLTTLLRRIDRDSEAENISTMEMLRARSGNGEDA